MAPLKYITPVLRSLIIFTAILGVIVAALNFIDMSIKFNGANRVLIEHIKSHTGRDVRIDGELELTISFSPQLLVRHIHIADPDGFSKEDFITISNVRVGMSLIPLLSGQLYFSEISADQAKIKLTKKKDGSDNWSFVSTTQQAEAGDTQTAGLGSKSGMGRLSLDEIQLSNVVIIYNDESTDQVIDTRLDRLFIDIENITKPYAEISGSIQGHAYKLTFESDAIDTLFSTEPWRLHGSGQIAGSQTVLESRLQLTGNEISGNIDIDINEVDLGLLLDTLGIISEQVAATDKISIKATIRGSDLAELYQQAEIKLQLGKGYWNLPSTVDDQKKVLLFSSASSFTSWHKPVVLNIDGMLAGETIKLELKTNRLYEFFDDVHKLDVNMASNIAEIDITANGTLDLPVEKQQFTLDISLKGKDLEKLNPVLDAEFPPFNNFSVSGKLIVNNKGFILKSANAMIGDTKLQTSVVVETTFVKPLWTINLNSPQIQLKDFAFNDWNIKPVDNANSKTSPLNDNVSPLLLPLRHLEDTVRSPEMHLNLNIKVDKLLSGEDKLGKARFQLHMRDDSFSIQNADIELPGGRIKSSLSLNTEDKTVNGHLKLDIDKLDYGITTRLFKSDSQVDGAISTRIDIKLGGKDFTRLLDNATGQFDIALWPKNTRPAKILNLWATNLYLILLPELKKKESKVNCLVGLMDIDNGIMKEKFFAIDTTKLWIYGNINVDFKLEQVKLSLFPQSKTARLFALQSPIRAHGSFQDMTLEINPVDLTLTYITFVTSPLHVPTRWIFADKPAEDGSAVCEQFFDREYVINLNKELKLKEEQAIKEMLDAD